MDHSVDVDHGRAGEARQRAAGISARDMVVLGAMTLVALAVGATLIVQGGFDLPLATMGAAIVLSILVLLHIVLRRASTVGRLQSKVAELERRVSERFDQGIADHVSLDHPTSEEVAALQSLDREFALDGGKPRDLDAEPADLDAEPEARRWEDPNVVNDIVRQLANEIGRTRPDRERPANLARSRSEAVGDPAGNDAGEPFDNDASAVGLDAQADAATARGGAEIASPVTPTAIVERSQDDDVVAVGGPESALVEQVRQAARDGAVEVHLQPIVSLADRKIRYYEVFPRLRCQDGTLLTEEAYAGPARATGVMTVIERAQFSRTVQILKKLIELGKARAMFYGISASSLRDGTFLRVFHEMMRVNRAIADYLIFEMTAAEFVARTDEEREGMETLARLGFSFSIDRLHEIDLDMAELADSRVAFLKIDADGIAGKTAALASLADAARAVRIEIVADGLGKAADTAELMALGIHLGQGALFSEPRPVKPEVLRSGSAAGA